MNPSNHGRTKKTGKAQPEQDPKKAEPKKADPKKTKKQSF